MIKFFNGDLLKSGCDIICHQVNEYGVMGAGIAKQIKEKYPKAFDDYTKAIKEAKGKGKNLPMFVLSKQPDSVVVANMFTQRNVFRARKLCATDTPYALRQLTTMERKSL